ncbi:MAG: IS1 family transposase [Nitrospiraceae bacterium]|nr:IS1 family transposase [Nitrospiraceae bacterium]
MNKLPLAKRTQILAMLCEGSSMRSISRIADVSINTVAKLLVEAGEACLAIHDENVRDVTASRIQCDEIWSFCYAKAKNVPTAKAAPDGAGDVWTWTALDADTKLMVAYFVGDRGAESAMVLMDDLRARLANRVQLTTDGHKAYLEAVEGAFGADVDYAQLVKLYGSIGGDGPEKRYSPAECTGAKKVRREGNPDIAHVSTSYVERMNLSIRMQNRRFTRLTNAFSKKLDNHIHALALYFAFYNFCRIHKSLRVTPAMAAGLTDRLWTLEDIVAKMDAMAPAPAKRGPYKKRSAENSN